MECDCCGNKFDQMPLCPSCAKEKDDKIEQLEIENTKLREELRKRVQSERCL